MDLGIALAPESRRDQGLCLNLPIGLNINLPVFDRLTSGLTINRRREIADADRQIRDLKIKTPTRRVLASAMSGGNQQKIVIGKWLSHGAKLFIFDEPTVGVDVGTKAEIYRLFARLLEAGRRHHPDLVLPAGSLRPRRPAARLPTGQAGRQPQLSQRLARGRADRGDRRMTIVKRPEEETAWRKVMTVEATTETGPVPKKGMTILFGLTLLGLLLLLWLLLGVATDSFWTPNNISNLLRQGAMTAILAVGQTFVIITARHRPVRRRRRRLRQRRGRLAAGRRRAALAGDRSSRC